MIPEIRKYDSANLIIVGCPHWDQGVDIVAANPIIGFNNIAHSFHFYASDPNHQERLMAKADKAIKMGLPLMEANHLSWTNWNITDKDETTAVYYPAHPSAACWTNEQLSAAGSYIRDVLRELNK